MIPISFSLNMTVVIGAVIIENLVGIAKMGLMVIIFSYVKYIRARIIVG